VLEKMKKKVRMSLSKRTIHQITQKSHPFHHEKGICDLLHQKENLLGKRCSNDNAHVKNKEK